MFNAINIISDPLPNYTVTYCLSVTIILSVAYFSGSQNIVPQPSVSASTGKLLERQIRRPCPTTDSEI